MLVTCPAARSTSFRRTFESEVGKHLSVVVVDLVVVLTLVIVTLIVDALASTVFVDEGARVIVVLIVVVEPWRY